MPCTLCNLAERAQLVSCLLTHKFAYCVSMSREKEFGRQLAPPAHVSLLQVTQRRFSTFDFFKVDDRKYK